MNPDMTYEEHLHWERKAEDKMYDERLKLDIDHLIDSGINSLRVFNLIKEYIDQKLKITGLHDSDGTAIFFGDKVMVKVEINTDLHGDYSTYEIIKKGSIPVMSYVESEKGQVIPKGYMSCLLTDYYSEEDLALANNISTLKPRKFIRVVDL